MDLESLKLVTFAILMQTDGGIGAKEPGWVRSLFQDTQRAASEEELRNLLPEYTTYIFDNYLQVWAAVEEAPAPVSEQERVEITPEGEKALEAAGEHEEPARPKKRGK